MSRQRFSSNERAAGATPTTIDGGATTPRVESRFRRRRAASTAASSSSRRFRGGGHRLALALSLLLSSGPSTPLFPSVLLPALPVASAFTVERSPHANDIERIVFGTAALSKASDPSGLLTAAYEKGFRRFDLAHTYGAGESERIFGRWLRDSPGVDRASLNVITKGGIGDDAFGDPDRPLLTRESLFDEVEESLEALGTDYVDLWMYHRDDARIPVERFVDWVNVVVASGKAKRWGVSNWNFDRFKSAHDYAKRKGLVPPSANSPQYSLAAPDGEVWPSTYSISAPENGEEIDWYQDRGVELLCWEVLAKGFMAKPDLYPRHELDPATFSQPAPPRGSPEWRTRRIQRAYCNDENYRRRNLAIQLAEMCGCNLAQIAMLYPLTRGEHISVIFGSGKADHLDDMAELRHLTIDDEAMRLLAGVQTEEEKRSFGRVPQLLGLGNNNVVPVQLSSAAKAAVAKSMQEPAFVSKYTTR